MALFSNPFWGASHCKKNCEGKRLLERGRESIIEMLAAAESRKGDGGGGAGAIFPIFYFFFFLRLSFCSAVGAAAMHISLGVGPQGQH